MNKNRGGTKERGGISASGFNRNEDTHKVWGLERLYVNNEIYCLKDLMFREFGHTSLHRHLKKDETFAITDLGSRFCVFLQGEFFGMYFDHGIRELRIKPGLWHSIFCEVPETLTEVSTHHSDDDVERFGMMSGATASYEWRLTVKAAYEKLTEQESGK